MSLARARELLAAWEAGTAREVDLAELRGLLPAVIDDAERWQIAMNLPRPVQSAQGALDERDDFAGRFGY